MALQTQDPTLQENVHLAMSAVAELQPHPPPSQPAVPARPPPRELWPLYVSPQPKPALRPLAPKLAPPPPPQDQTTPGKCFYDLPAELRNQVYELALANVRIHILPLQSTGPRTPHALILTSRQVRHEVLPIMHRSCRIRANVTDFNFAGVMAWLNRIPATEQIYLTKNPCLEINMCTSLKPDAATFGVELRRWLEMRTDPHRYQPHWRYSGALPKKSVASDLRRRAKRMSPVAKKEEFIRMLAAVGVGVQ